ncbi:regucalcin-like isoform X2 [Planococcus citri]
MSPQVIRITKPLELGEGPHWDSNSKALYFVDMYNSEIHKYLPESNLHTSAVVETINDKKPVTFIVPIEGAEDTFLIGYGGELATVEWNGVSNTTKNFKTLRVLEENYPAVRLNDGKVSPSGVIFAGSMGEKLKDGQFPPKSGNLFAYDPSTSTTKKLLSGLGIANGLTWSLDESIFYFIDSLSGQVKGYDYDSKNITLSNERVIFDFRDCHAFDAPHLIPDGMTIDISGHLWIAVHNGGQVYQINPKTKCIVSVIDFPSKPVTSVAFGGPSVEDLYVTSMHRDLSEEEKKEQSSAGCLFKVTGLGTKGIEGVGVNLAGLKK